MGPAARSGGGGADGAYSLSPPKAGSPSSSRSVGCALSILRTRAAVEVRPVNQGFATRSRRTSSRRVLPDAISADVTERYGVAYAAAKACVCAVHRTTAARV